MISYCVPVEEQKAGKVSCVECGNVIPDPHLQREATARALKKEDAMAQVHVPSVDSVICHEVTTVVSCTFDELVERFPAYSWAQVFAAVDRLSRQGTLVVSRTRCFGYTVSIGSAPPTPQSLQDRQGQALSGRLG